MAQGSGENLEPERIRVRRDIREATAAATRFYGGKPCVVTTRPDGNHWHHLDEDHQNWTASNIVPVSPEINHDIELQRRRQYDPVPYSISPERIALAARRHWDFGRFAWCYGCNRLGGFVALGCLHDADRAMGFAIEALHALRPIAAEWLAEDTLRRSVLPLLGEPWVLRIRHETLAKLSIEIAAFFLDHGDRDEFARWAGLGESIVRRIAEPLPTEAEVVAARIQQHRAFACLERGELDRGERLLRGASDLMGARRLAQGVSANTQHLALALSRQGKVGAAQEALGNYAQRYGPIEPVGAGTDRSLAVSGWRTHTRLLLVDATIALQTGEEKRALTMTADALDVVHGRGMRALGATPYLALEAFRAKYPEDHRLPRSQVAGPGSRGVRLLANAAYVRIGRRFDRR